MLTAISGAARGFVSLAIPRLFIGIGESIMTPASMSILSDRFPAKRLGFATSFYYMAAPIGISVSLLIAGYLEPLLGWRGCFYALGGMGVLLSLALLFFRETPRPLVDDSAIRLTRKSALPTLKDTMRRIRDSFLGCPALLFTVSGAVMFHVFLGAAIFEQIWFVEERGFDRNKIAELTGWIALVGGVSGNLLGGLGSDYFLQKTGIGRPMFMFWITLFIMPMMLAYRFVDPTSVFFMVCMFLAFFQLGCLYGPVFGTIQELVPTYLRGTITAVALLMINVAGLGLGVTSSGLLLDWLMLNEIADPYTVTLVSFTLISFSAIPLFFFAGRRFNQDRQVLRSGHSIENTRLN
jgi:MFS family permease